LMGDTQFESSRLMGFGDFRYMLPHPHKSKTHSRFPKFLICGSPAKQNEMWAAVL